ncbi:hypothetical protein [Chryseobacterium jejuense]|uniref:hypothetical protein n=1 Tax=Chryseobacterium jejuense TaxID=445960 RepID=UPI001AEA0E8B|nr:hypothetical protein [Chryseobacterium jejuense]MBP2619651.1 tetratricopeptide (TPR) repeat protein [Chryseobacterium jejuense]
MKNLFKFIFIIAGIAGAILIYVIAKDTFKKNDSVFRDGISYYTNGKYEAAEQIFQNEAEQGNKQAYSYLGHIKLIQRKPKEAEKYLLLALEELKNNPDISVKQSILFNLGSTYLNLRDDSKAKMYLNESSKLGNKSADQLLKKYNLN